MLLFRKNTFLPLHAHGNGAGGTWAAAVAEMPLPSTENVEINLLFECSSIIKSILKVHSNYPLEGFSWKPFSEKFIFGELHCKYHVKPGGREGERSPNLHCFPWKLPECVRRWFGGLISCNKETERFWSQPRNSGVVAELCCCSRVRTARGWILRHRLFRAARGRINWHLDRCIGGGDGDNIW